MLSVRALHWEQWECFPAELAELADAAAAGECIARKHGECGGGADISGAKRRSVRDGLRVRVRKRCGAAAETWRECKRCQ